MEDYREIEKNPVEETPPYNLSSNLAFQGLVGGLVLAILMIFGLGYGLYELNRQANDSFQDLNDQVAELQDTLPLFADKIDRQQEVLASLATDWDVLQERIGVTESELQQARTLAENLRKEQTRSVETLSSQLVTKASIAELEELKTESIGRFEKVDDKLAGVEADVERSLSELEETWAELADLGVKVTEQGQFIAVNGEGIEELNKRGEKKYVAFDAVRGEPFRIGHLAIELRDTRQNKNRAKLRLYFDDKRIVRGRIATNQPLILYVGKERVPYEVVLNEVEKGRVQGYVSFPKEAASTAALVAQNSSK